MIDRFRRLFGGTTEPDSPTAQPVVEWPDELKWKIAQHAQYRCASCGVPEFRVECLYLVESHDEESEEDHIPACEECLEHVDREEETNEEHRIPTPPLGRRGYLIDPDGARKLRHRKHGEQELVAIEETPDPDDENDKWMGEYPRRKLVEEKYHRPHAPLWIGYEKRGNKFKEIGAEFGSLFKHVWINGTTGMGKSVLLYNLGMQLMWGGHGLCVIDPHDDLIDDLLQAVPAHRREDVIVIDPGGATDTENMVALNFLEVEPEPDESGYHQAVDEQVDLIESVLRGGGSWGSRMGPICKNLTRSMILSERSYTFLDMRDILIDEEARQRFAAQITDEGYSFVSKYTQQIAEMGRDELDSLIRKLNPWAQSLNVRHIVGHDESSISFHEIVRERKIVLVKNKIGNEEMERLIATGLLRGIWREIQRQPKDDRQPFFLMMDEAHEAMSVEMDMDTLLTGARKFKFGLILMSQYLGKIDSQKVREAIKEQCNTFITLRVRGDAADDLAHYYGGINPANIRNMGQYQALVSVEINGNPHGPLHARLLAPYPGIRTPEEAEEWIEEPAKVRHGVSLTEEPADEDDKKIPAATEEEEEDDPLELTAKRKMQVLKAMLDEALLTGTDGSVLLEDCWPRIIDYHPEGQALAHASQKGALIDSIPAGEDGDIELSQDDSGDMWVRVTAQGRRDIMATGTSASSGGVKHRKLLKDSYEPLTKLGGQVRLPVQNGDEMPDGSVTVDTAQRADDDVDTSIIEELTGGRETAIEAESSTGDSKAGQTAQNVAETTGGDQRCLLLCREHNAEKIWKTLTDPPFVSQYSDVENGEKRLYNLGNLHISGEKMLRPDTAANTVWIHDLETDEYVLKDSNGTEHHRFGNGQAVMEDAGAYPETMFSSTTDVPDGWKTVKKPFIPDYAFEDGIPDREDWEIVIVPDAATDPEELSIYRNGEKFPLFKGERNPLWESDRDANDDTGARTQTDTSEEESGLFDDALDRIDDLPDFD
ncbi:type IV secretory system conjugative DNA transfer family protein [Halocatena marina]|uniref:type IV secretory system conjugative DNA transfer family protein n=1 Tax=Halocatena marina TaxID=2934937 RepID=UPI00200E6C2A|nr:hypothetical protein [Halocatena marina]